MYCFTLETASTIYSAKKYPPPFEGLKTCSVSAIKSTQFSADGLEASTVTIFLLGAFKLVANYNLLPSFSMTYVSLLVWSNMVTKSLLGLDKSFINNLFPDVETLAETNK